MRQLQQVSAVTALQLEGRGGGDGGGAGSSKDDTRWAHCTESVARDGKLPSPSHGCIVQLSGLLLGAVTQEGALHSELAWPARCFLVEVATPTTRHAPALLLRQSLRAVCAMHQLQERERGSVAVGGVRERRITSVEDL